MSELPVASCREHLRAFLELNWTPFAKKSSSKYGTYVILEHRDLPWFLQIPCPGDDVILDPLLVRRLIRDSGATEDEYLEVFRRASR